MGNRQSSPQDGQQQQQQQNQPDANGRTTNASSSSSSSSSGSGGGGGAIRPGSRLQLQRDTLRSAFIPVNENQRRDERRLRRERIREQQLNGDDSTATAAAREDASSSSAALLSSVTEAMFAAAALRNASASTPAAEAPNISPFSRMIASVISEAVVTSFRNGHIPTTPQQGDSAATTPPPAAATAATTAAARAENVRQELTMHLSPEVFQQMEPGSTENSFMRFIRLPVIVTSVSTAPASTAVNADGEAPTLTPEESEVTRIIMLPVFLYGIRSNPTTTAPTTSTPPENTINEEEEEEVDDDGASTPTRRRSARLRAAAASAASTPPTPTPTTQGETTAASTQTPNGQWTVYIISGPNVDGIVSENASYEELLDLASIIGPARLPTVSQEAIDDVIPKVKFNLEVKQSMVGNSEGCQICLTNYQSQDEIRILGCHHGFHDECICKWLTQGRNQCPLCRVVPVPVQES